MADIALQGQGMEINVKSLSVGVGVQGEIKSIQMKALMCKSKFQYKTVMVSQMVSDGLSDFRMETTGIYKDGGPCGQHIWQITANI